MPFPRASASEGDLAACGNDERLRLAIEAARIGTYDWDLITGTATCSSTFEEIHSLEPGSLTADPQAFLRVVHPDDREFLRDSIDACLQHELPLDLEFRIITPVGDLRWIAAKFRMVGGEEATRLVGAAFDVTDRKCSENRLATQYAVATVLAESETLAAATPGILRAICTSLGWDMGAIWVVERESHALQCLDIWRCSGEPDSPFASLIREQKISRGSGLVGRVWESGAPEWAPDIAGEAALSWAPIAGQEGLRTAFGFPLRLGTDVIGVMEFFSRDVRKPDTELLKMFTSIGSQIGQVFERIRTECSLRLSYKAEKESRERADQARDRIALLQNLTSALSDALTSEKVADIIVTHAVPAMGARAAIVFVLSMDGSKLRSLAAVGYDGSVTDRFASLPVDAPMPISDCIRTRELIAIPTLWEQLARYPAIAGIPEYRDEALVAIPMLWKDRAIGAVGLTFAASRSFDADERALLLNIGQQCAQALERARLYEAKQSAHAVAASSLEALQKSEAKFRRLVESNVIGVVFGESSAITGANQSFIETVGYTPEDLLAGKLNWTDMTPPEFRHLDERAMDETRRRRAFTPYEKEIQRKDGSRVPVLVGGASFDIDLSSHWVSFVLDLTRRKAMEQALSNSEFRFRAIFDQAPLGIVEADLSGKILMVNQKYCDLTGYTRQELSGELFHVHTHADDWAANVELLGRAMAGETSAYCVEKRLVRKDGSIVWTHMTVAVVLGEDLNPGHVLGMVEDITERKLMQERLVRSQKLESLAVLAGGIAHDFNNLLTGIMGNASLAMAGPEGGDLVPMLADVVDASKKASVLTTRMLAYAGKGQWIVEPMDLSILVRQVCQSLAVGRLPNVTVRAELEPNLPPVVCDPLQIRQLMTDLVTNAVESIGEGIAGNVLVTTEVERVGGDSMRHDLASSNAAPGLYVVLKVQDNGCGMDEETQSKIFDPFFTTKFIGRGLGLAAAAGIVRAHGGAIRVSSRRGEGTTFRVFLPASEAEADPGRGSGI